MRAAKARIDRMCCPKSKRKDLEVPAWLVTEWKKSGNRTSMAQLLQQENFEKDSRAWICEDLNMKPRTPQTLYPGEVYRSLGDHRAQEAHRAAEC